MRFYEGSTMARRCGRSRPGTAAGGERSGNSGRRSRVLDALVVLQVFVLREVDDKEQLGSLKTKVVVATNFISWNGGSHRLESKWRTVVCVDLEYIGVLRKKIERRAHDVRKIEGKRMDHGLAAKTHQACRNRSFRRW